MKKSMYILTISFALAIALAACKSPSNEQAQSNDSDSQLLAAEQGILEANDRLYEGLNAMFAGDMQVLNALWSHSESTTYMGPFGGSITGWTAISEEFNKVAAMKLGGKITGSNVHVFPGTDIGYTTCVEVGENISPDGTPVEVSHRTTNIFQLQDGHWRLIHHHTDISTQLETAFDQD
jgi:ketosteroid isomerase-like protein